MGLGGWNADLLKCSVHRAPRTAEARRIAWYFSAASLNCLTRTSQSKVFGSAPGLRCCGYSGNKLALLTGIVASLSPNVTWNGFAKEPFTSSQIIRRNCTLGRMDTPIPVAVVGAGYFGRFHAKHYDANPNARLVAVVDTDHERARAVADEFDAEEALAEHLALVGRVQAVSIATSTPAHFDVAAAFLEAGVHVLIEKPITDRVDTAEALVAKAEASNRILQVGHIERFSAPFRALAKEITHPLFIESERIAMWTGRSGDVDVVLDLMIHDIDLIQGLIGARVERVDAVGAPILNQTEDMASARITFDNGSVANVTASRISTKSSRLVRVFQPDSYLVCDFANSRLARFLKRGDPMTEGLAAIEHSAIDIPKEDSLGNEIAEFLHCIRSGSSPTVDGHAGKEALRVASLINDSMRAHRRRVEMALANSRSN